MWPNLEPGGSGRAPKGVEDGIDRPGRNHIGDTMQSKESLRAAPLGLWVAVGQEERSVLSSCCNLSPLCYLSVRFFKMPDLNAM